MLKLDIQMFADGKVVIETDLNQKGFEKGLDQMQSIAKKGFQGLAASVGVAAVALTGLVSKSVKAAGELEQQIGGTEAVFGEFAETVQKKAAGAFEKMGVSANDFMATANKMGALMQGSGISIEDSMDLSTKAMQRAADVASIMGIDLNSAMESIAGAAKGNFTMMDNLGVAMNATTIEAYALSKGIDESYASMDNAQKIGLAMEMFLEKTSYAAGNYAKENETFAGSFNTLKASIENFLSGAGDIDPVIDSVISFGEILVKSVGEITPKIVEGLVKLVDDLIPMIPGLFRQMLPTIIDGAVQLVNSVIKMLPELLMMIAQVLPEQMPVIVDAILQLIPTLIDMMPLFIEAGAQILIALAEGLLKSIPSLLSKIPQIVASIIRAFSSLPSTMANIGLNLVRGIWNGISSSLSWIKNKISGWVGNVTKFIKKLFGIHSPSTVMRDEVGKYLAQGMGVGFDEELDSVYRDMQRAIDIEQGKLQASVETGSVFNTLQNSTPVAISVNADVEMDSQKVGRLVTPTVTRTIKNGGGV